MRKILFMAVMNAKRFCPSLKAWADSLTLRKLPNMAVRAAVMETTGDISIIAGDALVNIIPPNVQLDKIVYKQEIKAVRVTDGAADLRRRFRMQEQPATDGRAHACSAKCALSPSSASSSSRPGRERC